MSDFLNSTTVIIIFDVLIFLLGGYLIFNAIKMKKTDVMPSILLTPKELKFCRDPYKFIDYMFPFLLIFGIVCVAFGAVSFIGDMWLEFPPFADGIAIIVLLAAWFGFSLVLRRAKREFM